MKIIDKRSIYKVILIGCFFLVWGPGRARAIDLQDEVGIDGSSVFDSGFSREEAISESGWDQSYVFPVPPADMHIWDKSLPLPEALRKIITPGRVYYAPELVIGATPTGAFPLPLNRYVQAWVERFAGPSRGTFASWMRRGGLYREMIMTEINKRGMPEELFYLCMIESGFTPKITSWAGARGLWQFIPGTGRRYGLAINYWVDERCDPEKSTKAALNYLGDNYRLFGDWHLAAAAYNTGEANVDRRLRSTGSENYWELVELRALHRETLDYVPKMCAAAIVGSHLEQYGFYNLQILPAIRYAEVSVDNAVDLGVIARCAGVTSKEIQWLNPELMQFCTPPGGGGYKIKIPPGRTQEFRRAYAALGPEEKTTFQTHTVSRGETIRSVAAGYQASAKMVAAMNGLQRESMLNEGQVLIIPVPRGTRYDPTRKPPPPISIEETQPETTGPRPPRIQFPWSQQPSEQPTAPTTGTTPRRKKPKPKPKPKPAVSQGPRRYLHEMEVGETLWGISQRTGISVADLKKWNHISDPASIQYGDTIVIYAPGASNPLHKPPPKPTRKPPKPAASAGPTRTIHFTVREGDRLYLIARHYGIRSQDIITQNHLGAGGTIKPGQKLTLTVPKAAPRSLPPTAGSPSASAAPSRPKPPPASSPAPASRPRTRQPSGTRRVSYTVRSGDSLWAIARYHNVHVSDILAWNGLAGECAIKPGQTIRIYVASNWKPGHSSSASPPAASPARPKPKPTPAATPSPRRKKVVYTVKPGDTMWAIARAYDVHVADIRQWNGLSSDTVAPGRKLTIYPGPAGHAPASAGSPAPKPKPKPEPKPAPKPKPKPVAESHGTRVTYTVKAGDTLSGIAARFGVKVSEIKKWNNLTSDVVKPGKKLIIYKPR